MLTEVQIEFLVIQWRLGKVTAEDIATLVDRGHLSREQADVMLAMPQV